MGQNDRNSTHITLMYRNGSQIRIAGFSKGKRESEKFEVGKPKKMSKAERLVWDMLDDMFAYYRYPEKLSIEYVKQITEVFSKEEIINNKLLTRSLLI